MIYTFSYVVFCTKAEKQENLSLTDGKHNRFLSPECQSQRLRYHTIRICNPNHFANSLECVPCINEHSIQ
jgi:hypothetical protein